MLYLIEEKKMNVSKCLIAFVTTPNLRTAHKIIKKLLEEEVISSAQISKSIQSYYWWNNKIEKKIEFLIMMTTLKKNFKILERGIIKLHPYKVPQVICIPISNANKTYLKWINQYCQHKHHNF
jgi:periplasmic divalent cation tolerance protein